MMPCDLHDAVGPEQVEQHSQDMGMAAGALRSMTEEKVALEKRLHRLERQVLLAQACMYPCLFAPCALRVLAPGSELAHHVGTGDRPSAAC